MSRGLVAVSEAIIIVALLAVYCVRCGYDDNNTWGCVAPPWQQHCEANK